MLIQWEADPQFQSGTADGVCAVTLSDRQVWRTGRVGKLNVYRSQFWSDFSSQFWRSAWSALTADQRLQWQAFCELGTLYSVRGAARTGNALAAFTALNLPRFIAGEREVLETPPPVFPVWDVPTDAILTELVRTADAVYLERESSEPTSYDVVVLAHTSQNANTYTGTDDLVFVTELAAGSWTAQSPDISGELETATGGWASPAKVWLELYNRKSGTLRRIGEVCTPQVTTPSSPFTWTIQVGIYNHELETVTATVYTNGQPSPLWQLEPDAMTYLLGRTDPAQPVPYWQPVPYSMTDSFDALGSVFLQGATDPTKMTSTSWTLQKWEKVGMTYTLLESWTGPDCSVTASCEFDWLP